MSNDAWKRFADEGYKHYQVVECGFKYNMMDLQAAIGLRYLSPKRPATASNPPATEVTQVAARSY